MTKRAVAALVGCAAVAAGVAAEVASPAPASRASSAVGGIAFEVEFVGRFEGSWRSTLTKPIDPSRYMCQGNDSSGTLASTVRRAGGKVTVIVATDLGGRSLYLDWGRSGGSWKGTVRSTRTGEGWLLVQSQGRCDPRPMTTTGCSSRTFATRVGLAGSSGTNRSVQRVYLDWLLEPDGSYVDCPPGTMGPASPAEGARALLDLRKLYRCGVRKPRGCRMRIGAERTYSVNENDGAGQGSTGRSRIAWSVTFVSVGRR